MTKRATIADIAQRAGLSKGAVSYALNGLPGVSESTRQRVLKLAAEMGWRPNSAARALSASRAGALGLVMARPASTLGVEPFFMKLLSGIENTLAAHSTALLLQVVPDRDAEVEAYRRWWAERRVDGIFLIDLRIEDKRVLVLEELGLPAVVIGGPGHHGRLPAVWSDDASAMAMVVEYLAALGHRRVARVAGPSGLLHTELRSQAFDEVAARLELDSAVTVATDYSPEQGAQATRRLLSGSAAAVGGDLRQRRHGRGRHLGGPRDGRGRPRRPVDRRLGRLGAVRDRPPAPDRAQPRHHGLRRPRRRAPARPAGRRQPSATSRTPCPG